MESKDLDKLFQDTFEHAEETPSNRVWEGIEQELAKEKKVIPFYIKYRTQLSIAATFLLFFGMGLTFYKKPIPSNNKQADEILSAMEKQTTPKANTSESVSENIAETPTKALSTHAEVQILANAADEKQVIKDDYMEVEKTADYSEEISQSDEIVEIKNGLAYVEADIEISKPDLEEVKTLDPISSDVQISFAYTEPKEEVKSSIVTRVLNGITKNILTKSIDMQENREIEFRNDEEGSITVNIFNSLARK